MYDYKVIESDNRYDLAHVSNDRAKELFPNHPINFRYSYLVIEDKENDELYLVEKSNYDNDVIVMKSTDNVGEYLNKFLEKNPIKILAKYFNFESIPAKLIKLISNKISKYSVIDSVLHIKDIEGYDFRYGTETVVIEFDDDDEFEKVFNITNDSARYGYYSLFHPYNNDGPVDHYSVKEDCDQGYGFYEYLNEENYLKFSELIFLVNGEKINPNELNADITREFTSKLYATYGMDFEDTLQDYYETLSTDTLDNAKTLVYKEIVDYFKNTKLTLESYNELGIRIVDLIQWYVYFRNPYLSIKSLITLIYENFLSHKNFPTEDYYENVYEYYYISPESILQVNETFSTEIDTIKETIVESIHSDTHKLVSTILSKFELNVKYPLPIDPKIKFKIDKIDLVNDLIVLSLYSDEPQTYDVKSMKTSEFFTFIYQYKLF